MVKSLVIASPGIPLTLNLHSVQREIFLIKIYLIFSDLLFLLRKMCSQWNLTPSFKAYRDIELEVQRTAQVGQDCVCIGSKTWDYRVAERTKNKLCWQFWRWMLPYSTAPLATTNPPESGFNLYYPLHFFIPGQTYYQEAKLSTKLYLTFFSVHLPVLSALCSSFLFQVTFYSVFLAQSKASLYSAFSDQVSWKITCPFSTFWWHSVPSIH